MAADKLEEKLGRATKVSPVLEFCSTLVKIVMYFENFFFFRCLWKIMMKSGYHGGIWTEIIEF